MARHQQQIREAANQNQYALEQRITIDDSLLPSAEELAKFNEINSSIVSWIMQRAEKEQDARIKFNFDSVNLAKSEQKTIKTSLWLAFVIAVAAMLSAGVFIFLGKEIAGSIFGGAVVLMCVQAFLKFGRNQKQ